MIVYLVSWTVIAIISIATSIGVSASTNGSRSDPPVQDTSVTTEHYGRLLANARAERDRGSILNALAYYERAANIGGLAAQAVTLREVCGMLDGLRVTVVAGDRQIASVHNPPDQALQARVVLLLGSDLVVAASDVPIAGIWTTGNGVVRGETASDATGTVTHRILHILGTEQPRYEIVIDESRIPFQLSSPTVEAERLLSDARAALATRRARFEFVSLEAQVHSRVLVLIDEVVFGEVAEESLLSDRLTTALVDRGVKVVGVSELGKSNLEKLEQSLERNEFDAVRSEYYSLCDYILYGRIEIRQDYVNVGGGKWSVARGRVSLYSLLTPDIVASADFSDVEGLAGPDQPWIQSAENALRNSASLIEQKLVPLTVVRLGE